MKEEIYVGKQCKEENDKKPGKGENIEANRRKDT
jgi:hypothetical protein